MPLGTMFRRPKFQRSFHYRFRDIRPQIWILSGNLIYNFDSVCFHIPYGRSQCSTDLDRIWRAAFLAYNVRMVMRGLFLQRNRATPEHRGEQFSNPWRKGSSSSYRPRLRNVLPPELCRSRNIASAPVRGF